MVQVYNSLNFAIAYIVIFSFLVILKIKLNFLKTSITFNDNFSDI